MNIETLKFNLQTFATGTTKMAQMVNPQVMGDMISAALPKAIKFTPFAKIDNSLNGVPGDTLTIPSWGYIGDADDVAEGADVTISQMSSSTKTIKVKKAVKGVEITDEAKLSGYGDPVGEATHQLTMSIASKVENDVVKALGEATLTVDKGTEKISYAGVVAGVDKFAEEDDMEKFLFVHPTQVTTLRQDVNFIDKTKYGNDVMMTGEIGMISGCRVVKSRRVPEEGGTKFNNFIIATTPESTDGTPVLPAVTILMKRNVILEADRDIVGGKDVIVANEHYGVKLTNESKVVKITFLK